MVWTIEGTPCEERSHGGIRVLTTGIIHCSLTAEFALITPPLHAWISRAGPPSASALSQLTCHNGQRRWIIVLMTMTFIRAQS